MKRFFALLAVLFLVTLTLAACTTPTPAPTFTPAPTDTATPQPSATLLPILTDTPTPLPTATLTATATWTPTPTPDFSQVRVTAQDYRAATSNYLIILAFPGIKEPYLTRLNGNSYNCVLDENYPDQYFCVGPITGYMKPVAAEFTRPGETTPFFTGYIGGYPFPEPTPLPVGAPDTWCPLRGQHITCEPEYYTKYDCWITTCYDLCGYYYSVDTCLAVTPTVGP